MKRSAVLLLFLAAAATIIGNPIALPSVIISELRFAADDSWEMELVFRDLNPNIPIDSMFLISGSGRVALPASMLPAQPGGIVTLTRNTLQGSLDISCTGDSLLIEYRVGGPVEKDVLVFGTRCTAAVQAPHAGQSIVRVKDGGEEGVFALTNVPSMGAENDSSGACGTLHGYVIDAGGIPVSGYRFILDYPFTTAANGEYHTRVYARTTAIPLIYYYHDLRISSCAIEKLLYSMAPDSTIERDIVVTSPLASADDVPAAGGTGLFRLYPNPGRPGGTLQYSSTLPVASMGVTLILTDTQGRTVLEKDIRQSEGPLALPPDLPAGLYLAAIRSHGKIYDALKLAILK